MFRLCICLLVTAGLFGDDVFSDPRGYWVTVVATAYSPYDEIDHWYHATKGKDRWMTAGRRDVREHVYGIAVPRDAQGSPMIPYGSKIWVPPSSGYLAETYPVNRFFIADDTGGKITSRTRTTGVIHIDLRYHYESGALQYGTQQFSIFVIPLDPG